MRSAVPLTLRWADDCLYVVGSAFMPLGGDELALDIVVGEGASLTVRTVAASMALPNRQGDSSRFTVTARVAAGASLRWLAEPGIAAAGCRHLNDVRLDLAGEAEVVWREEVVLGRHGEAGGEWRSKMGVTCDGSALLDQDFVVGGPDWGSPAVGGGARAAGSLLVAGPGAPAEPSLARSPTGRAVTMPLAGSGAALTSALASDARSLRQLLSRPREAVAIG